jgi:hypothetical protein
MDKREADAWFEGCFWFGPVILGAIGWVIGWLVAGAKNVTGPGWVALGVGSGLLVLAVYHVVLANGWRNRKARRDRRRLRRQARKATRTPVRWW